MKIFKTSLFKTFNKTDYYNSKEFYQKHPDLAPRNIYLYEGRVLKMEDVRKYLDKMTGESFGEKCSRWFSNLKNIFTKTK